MMLPYGARPIVEARMQGKRPAEMLVVSLVGHLDEMNPVVVADPSKAYDWRFVIGLEVCVFAKPGVKFHPVVCELYRHAPAWIGLWDVESQEGADCIVHLKPEAMNKSRFVGADFDAIYWPWLKSENKEFRGTHEVD